MKLSVDRVTLTNFDFYYCWISNTLSSRHIHEGAGTPSSVFGWGNFNWTGRTLLIKLNINSLHWSICTGWLGNDGINWSRQEHVIWAVNILRLNEKSRSIHLLERQPTKIWKEMLIIIMEIFLMNYVDTASHVVVETTRVNFEIPL